MTQTSTSSTLYEQDFNLWIEDTVNKLKAHQFDEVDLDKLIEEIQALARRDRRELESRLRVLFAHLLKRVYVKSPDNFRGWEITIREQRNELRILLKQSPSLKEYLLELWNEVWQIAIAEVQEDYSKTEFPRICPFPQDLEFLLTQRFWEDQHS